MNHSIFVKKTREELTIKIIYTQKNFSTKKISGPVGLIGDFYQLFREGLTQILHKLFQKTEEKGTLPNTFHETSIALKQN